MGSLMQQGDLVHAAERANAELRQAELLLFQDTYANDRTEISIVKAVILAALGELAKHYYAD